MRQDLDCEIDDLADLYRGGYVKLTAGVFLYEVCLLRKRVVVVVDGGGIDVGIGCIAYVYRSLANTLF